MIASLSSQVPSEKEMFQGGEITLSSSVCVLKDIPRLMQKAQKNLGTPLALRGTSCLIHHCSPWSNFRKTFLSFVPCVLTLCFKNPDINFSHNMNYSWISLVSGYTVSSMQRLCVSYSLLCPPWQTQCLTQNSKAILSKKIALFICLFHWIISFLKTEHRSCSFFYCC